MEACITSERPAPRRRQTGESTPSEPLWQRYPVPACIVGFIVVCLVANWIGGALDFHDKGIVERYCMYGSVSYEQAAHCEAEVSAEEVRARDTEAARFGLGKLNECGPAAGPLCEGYTHAPEDDGAGAGAGPR